MWFLRRMLRISWTSHTTNEDIMLKADRRRKLLNYHLAEAVTIFRSCHEKGRNGRVVCYRKNRRKKGQRKTMVNVCVQYGEVDITASIRSHQKCGRQEDVEIRDRQRLQKTRHLERERDVYMCMKFIPRRLRTKSSSFILRSGLMLLLWRSVLSMTMAKASRNTVSARRN